MTYEDALAVLADPTRRNVFLALKEAPLSVADLAKDMPVSRPAVSQHLRALKQAGLVQDHHEGTRRIYAIRLEGLSPLRRWLDSFWDDVLDAYKKKVENHVTDNHD